MWWVRRPQNRRVRIRSGSWLILLTFCLAGCGFQLRGTSVLDLGPINVIGDGATKSLLEETLEDYGVAMAPDATSSLLVQVAAEQSSRRPVSTTATIDAAEYELRLQVEVQASRGSDVVLPKSVVVNERIYAVDSLNLSASYEEQQILLKEMREALVRQIIRQLEVALSAVEGKEAE